MNPDTWIKNLFSNKDNANALFGDVYVTQTEPAQERSIEEDDTILDTGETDDNYIVYLIYLISLALTISFSIYNYFILFLLILRFTYIG